MSDHRVSYGVTAAACICVVAQSASNALFSYDLGGLAYVEWGGTKIAVDGAILASLSVAVPLVGAHSATVLATEPSAPRVRYGAALALCLGWSTLGVTSHVLRLQQHHYDKESARVAAYASAKRTQEDAAAKVARLTKDYETARTRSGEPGRSLSVIQSEIESVRVKPDAWRVSGNCTTGLNTTWVRDACEPFLALQRERMEAVGAGQRAATAADTRRELSEAETARDTAERELRAVDAPSAPWGVRVALAQIAPWFTAVLIEFVATFGFALARRPNAPPTPRVEVAAPRPEIIPRQRNPPRPSSLAGLLEGISTGATTAPECTLLADGWIDATQRALANVLGVTAATVCRELEALEASGSIATRKAGRRVNLKWIGATA